MTGPDVTVDGSSLTPGPMVDDSDTFFRYVPFEPFGLALMTASTNALIFSTRACSVKLAVQTAP